MNLNKYGFVSINELKISKEEKEIFKSHENHIYKNLNPDPILQTVRPYIYYEHPAIIFEIFIFNSFLESKNYIEGRLKQFKAASILNRLTFLVDTWAIDIAMEDVYNELSDKDKERAYIENRKRKEFDFEDYDKKYKPKSKKSIKLPKELQNKKEITIYRGIGDKSNKSLKGTLSWTLDLEVAKFFKNRFDSKNGWIWAGKCDPKDINKYYEHESEVLVDCKYVKDIKKLDTNTINEKQGNRKMKLVERMNVCLISKDSIALLEKNGSWFKELFIPLIKSNKDNNIHDLDYYWNEIRDVLLGKKNNNTFKVIKHKDIKFISFKVSDSQVLAFAIGSEKIDSLEDIYNLTVKETKTTEISNKKQPAEKTTNNTESKLVEVIKKALKPFGDVKQVDEVKMNNTSRRVNIQIVTNKSDEQMWDIINEKIKPIFADKFDVEVEETSDIGQKTILCPVILSIKSNKSNKSNNKAATENNKNNQQ